MKMILRDHPSLQYAYNNLQWGDFEFMLRGTFSDLVSPFTHIFNDTTTNSRTKKKKVDNRSERTELICGFKVMYNQLPMQAQLRHENMRGTRFETWAVLENIKLVHLVRRSHIRRVLSVLRMKATHVAHVRDPANVTTSSMTPLVDIEAKTFVDMVMKSVSASNKMSKSLRDSMPKTSVLEVEYEQLVDNAGQFHRVVDFISPDLARFVQRMKATTLQRSPKSF